MAHTQNEFAVLVGTFNTKYISSLAMFWILGVHLNFYKHKENLKSTVQTAACTNVKIPASIVIKAPNGMPSPLFKSTPLPAVACFCIRVITETRELVGIAFSFRNPPVYFLKIPLAEIIVLFNTLRNKATDLPNNMVSLPCIC